MSSCAGISQTTVQKDSLKISPEQVKNVYEGLKLTEHYKLVSIELDSIIQSRNSELKKYMLRNNISSEKLDELQEKKLKLSVENEKLKHKKIPIYRYIFLFLAGFGTGIYISR